MNDENKEKQQNQELPETPKILFPEIPSDIPDDFRKEIDDSLRALESGQKTFDDLSPEVKKQLCAKAPFGFFIVSELTSLYLSARRIYADDIRQEVDRAEKRRGERPSAVEIENLLSLAVWDWIHAGSPGDFVIDSDAGGFIIDRFRQRIGNTKLNELRKNPVAQEFRVIKQFFTVMPTGGEQFAARKNKNRNGAKYFYSSEYHQLTIEGMTSTVSVMAEDVSNYTVHNRDARKIFTFTLQCMNHTAQFRGGFFKGKISYSLAELVENGVYSDLLSARRGFLTGANLLTGIKAGSIKNLNSKTSEKTAVDMTVLFTGVKLKNGICSLTLNNELSFDKRAGGFSLLPGYYYGLKNHAQDLWDDISYYARQTSNLKKIADDGQFTITAKTIQANWGLPGIKKARQPGRDIRGVIEKARSEVLAENSQRRNPDELQIIISDEPTTREFLDHGKITVILSGELREYYTAIYNENKKKAADAVDRAKRRKVAAIIRNKEKKKSTEQATATQSTDSQTNTAQPADVVTDKEKATTNTTPKE